MVYLNSNSPVCIYKQNVQSKQCVRLGEEIINITVIYVKWQYSCYGPGNSLKSSNINTANRTNITTITCHKQKINLDIDGFRQ